MSGVSGSLSSRVMNMKFMKFSRNNNNNDEENTSDSRESSINNNDETSNKNFRDNSEWKLEPNTTPIKGKKVIRIKKKNQLRSHPNVIQDVGITYIQSNLNNAIMGRQTIRDDKETENEKDNKENENENQEHTKRPRDDEPEDDYDLDKIFKESMSKNKHNNKKQKKNKYKNK
ncbi:hypothetical protein NCAS_0A04550 [Naumovozyma castellii]|uniref:Uncharacterized protein n=1 Tax=Naumovozyma castellii TaxID=27288 RepID=G0V6C1_NAUCA|nr:hypothetical protein NCAS_0A04550 [Naumovozyma castellii CBS 4309]CCC67013.1 hypothetical protein NCAS_0A04550 [Naumovozyma castellii CBS 4309]